AEDDLAPGDAPQEIGASLARADHVSRVGDPRLGEDGPTVFYDVVLDVDPYSPVALDAMSPLKDATRAAAADAGVSEATVVIGGETAQTADIRSALDRDTVVIVALVLLVVTAVLVLLLRSTLAPLYLMAT